MLLRRPPRARLLPQSKQDATALDELRNRRRLVGLLTYVLLHLPQCREFGALAGAHTAPASRGMRPPI